MKDYYSPQKTGGQINSLISNQDSLAVIYSIEQLINPDLFGFGIDIKDFSIQCETDDDLCIVNKENKIFIQLKSTRINKSEFIDILDNFMTNYKNESRSSFYVLVVFENFTIDKKNIIEKIDAYRHILFDPNESPNKKLSVKNELIGSFNLGKYEDIIDRLRIINRPLFRDDQDVPAIFARDLRLTYGFKNQKEYLITNAFHELISEFEELRRKRGSINREKIETIILKNLVKDTLWDKFDKFIGYDKVENGYKRKEIINEEIIALEKGQRKAVKMIFKEWRKSYRKEFFKSFLLGDKRCPECGHPMIANLKGLRGIACPDCGFNPYLTMFSTCNCGNFEVIKTQPELTDSEIIKYINEFYYDDRKCKKCKCLISDEYCEFRVVMLPVPYPFDSYCNIDDIYTNSKY